VAESLRVSELIPGFEPQGELERGLVRDPTLLAGLAWGSPREGHPEGSVGAHVGDLLRRLEEWDEPEPRRSMLRFIALVHDSLKCRVKRWLPKTGENHHAMRARRFAERYTSDERLLGAIELHDRPYAIWRRRLRTGKHQDERIDAMLARLPDPGLFLRFVELDGSTPGKRSEPISWLRDELSRRGMET
jgi:hypothetical protein